MGTALPASHRDLEGKRDESHETTRTRVSRNISKAERIITAKGEVLCAGPFDEEPSEEPYQVQRLQGSRTHQGFLGKEIKVRRREVDRIVLKQEKEQALTCQEKTGSRAESSQSEALGYFQ